MKRLTLLVVLLGVMGLAAGFALEVTPSFTLAGSATLTWGVDLDNKTTGFNNAASADLTVTLIAVNSTDTHAGKAPIYGSITISNLTLYWLDGAIYHGDSVAGPGEATVSALLMMGPVEIGIYAAPAMDSDATVAIEDATDTGNTLINGILAAETTYLFSQYASGHGTYAKYAGDKWWVKFDVTSNGDYTTATPNAGNGYAVGLEGSLSIVSPMTFGLGVFQGITWTTNPTGGYVSVGLDLAETGSASVGFDWSLGAGVFTWEIGGKVQMNFNKEKTAYALARVYYDPQGVNGLDSALAFMVPANTVFGPVNFDVTAYLLDVMLNTQKLGILSHAGYTFTLGNGMGVAPSIMAAAVIGLAGAQTNTLNLTPQVIVTLASAPATTLTVGWTTANLLASPIGMGTITAALAVTY